MEKLELPLGAQKDMVGVNAIRRLRVPIKDVMKRPVWRVFAQVKELSLYHSSYMNHHRKPAIAGLKQCQYNV